MNQQNTTTDADLMAAKEFLNNMLAPLEGEERKNMLKMLLNLVTSP